MRSRRTAPGPTTTTTVIGAAVVALSSFPGGDPGAKYVQRYTTQYVYNDDMQYSYPPLLAAVSSPVLQERAEGITAPP